MVDRRASKNVRRDAQGMTAEKRVEADRIFAEAQKRALANAQNLRVLAALAGA